MHVNQIACMGDTLGSEPSKYQQEEKSNEIPPVAASERGRAQTFGVPSVRALRRRGCGSRRWSMHAPRQVRNHGAMGRVWEGPPERVKAP